MLTVVTFRWGKTFTAEHVNVARRMVARHYRKPHRFVCICDDPAGLDAEVEPIQLWDDFANLPSPHGPLYPSCYRRLKLFAPDIGELLGPRFVSIDLDFVATGDLAPLWDRAEDFIICAAMGSRSNHFNGSMFLMTAGARPDVWTDFDPKRSPALATAHRQSGSDQGWIGHKLGPKEATWGKADGVYSYRYSPVGSKLPEDSRLVFFNGKNLGPWEAEPQRHGWVREHWR